MLKLGRGTPILYMTIFYFIKKWIIMVVFQKKLRVLLKVFICGLDRINPILERPGI
jgi:hypothetical protein